MKRKYIEVKGEKIYLDEHKVKVELTEETPGSLVMGYLEDPEDSDSWWKRESDTETQVFFFKEALKVDLEELVSNIQKTCEVHVFTDEILTKNSGTFDDLIVVCFPKQADDGNS